MPAPAAPRSTPNPITLANWQDPEHIGWSYRHVRELIPTARVRHGSPSDLPRDERDDEYRSILTDVLGIVLERAKA